LLTIRFVSGSVYAYLDVPQEVFDGLSTSRSKGIFYNQEIKGKFLFTRVPADPQ
jgi:hypothetical protein